MSKKRSEHQNIYVYNTASASIKPAKLFRHLFPSHPHAPPQIHPAASAVSGEFLIKLPICFKLALSRVHLCKIPEIMKDLSIGGVCVWGGPVWVDLAVNWQAEGWDWGCTAPLWHPAATSVSHEVIFKHSVTETVRLPILTSCLVLRQCWPHG